MFLFCCCHFIFVWFFCEGFLLSLSFFWCWGFFFGGGGVFLDHPSAHGVPGPGIRSRLGIRSELRSQPKPQLWQHQIFNPVSLAGDGTCILALSRCLWYCYATMGTPLEVVFHVLELPSVLSGALLTCFVPTYVESTLFIFLEGLWFGEHIIILPAIFKS